MAMLYPIKISKKLWGDWITIWKKSKIAVSTMLSKPAAGTKRRRQNTSESAFALCAIASKNQAWIDKATGRIKLTYSILFVKLCLQQ